MAGGGCWVAYAALADTEKKIMEDTSLCHHRFTCDNVDHICCVPVGGVGRCLHYHSNVVKTSVVDDFWFWVADRIGKVESNSDILKFICCIPIFIGCGFSLAFMFLLSFILPTTPRGDL